MATEQAMQSGSSGPRVRGPYRTGIRRREQILDTAIEVFGQHGYTGGSLRMIAARIGVSPAALIRHFNSKEELLAAVLARSDAANGEREFSGETGLKYLRQWGTIIRSNVPHRGMVETLLGVASEASNPEHPARPFMVNRYRGLVEDLSSALREAIAAGEIAPMTPARVEVEARGLIALMDGLQLQWLIDDRFDVAATFEAQFGLLLQRWQTTEAPPA